jgi:hypothetical protein
MYKPTYCSRSSDLNVLRFIRSKDIRCGRKQSKRSFVMMDATPCARQNAGPNNAATSNSSMVTDSADRVAEPDDLCICITSFPDAIELKSSRF